MQLFIKIFFEKNKYFVSFCMILVIDRCKDTKINI